MLDARQVSDPYLAWTTLADSRLRRWSLSAAAGASLLIAITLVAAALAGAAQLILFAAAIALVGAGVAGLLVARAQAPMQLSIGADGSVRVRIGAQGPGEPQQVIYVSNLQVVLKSSIGLIAIWRDAISTTAFRRLVALSRWRLERRGVRAADGQDGEGAGGGKSESGGGRATDRRVPPAQCEAAN